MGPGFRLRGRLSGYLATSVVNRVRDYRRRSRRQVQASGRESRPARESVEPDDVASFTEQAARLNEAVAQLPDEQREVVLLRLKADMRFRDIAKLQQVSINTVQGRYRYGLNRLRSTLNGEAEE
jgi:RNA polymerase sigma-70 factor (ECF subfamily)